MKVTFNCTQIKFGNELKRGRVLVREHLQFHGHFNSKKYIEIITTEDQKKI